MSDLVQVLKFWFFFTIKCWNRLRFVKSTDFKLFHISQPYKTVGKTTDLYNLTNMHGFDTISGKKGMSTFSTSTRDRPFNLKGGGEGLWFFVSFRIFFSDNTRVRIFVFCRAKREFFFQNLTLGYMTKTLNQIISFFLHQNQNMFLKKTIPPPPPLQVKWSFP